MSSSNGSGEAFGRTLDELKRRGCSLLVVGPPDPTLRRAASGRLLGDGRAETRRRLFVHAGEPAVTPDVVAGPTDGTTARVVVRRTSTRSAGTAASPPTSGPSPATRPSVGEAAVHRRTVEHDGLGALAWAAGEEIDALERHASGLSPGELRLCVDSLDPLLAERSVRELRRFVETVGNRVRAVSGMAHAHLSADPTAPVVDELAPSFDGVVRLRTGADGSPEHRWTFPGRRVESGWLPL